MRLWKIFLIVGIFASGFGIGIHWKPSHHRYDVPEKREIPANDSVMARTAPPSSAIPAELSHVTLPPYIIESPDVLFIEVNADSTDVAKPPVALSPQLIRGQYLVGFDGTVRLGIWGRVSVSGLSIDEAAHAIRQHIFKMMQDDERNTGKCKVDSPAKLFVVVDMLAYNSKTYYVITDEGSAGEQMFSFPLTGGETVLDALARLKGLSDIASKRDIWIARPSPTPGMPEQILPIDFVAITQHAAMRTNCQLMPGDRIYVMGRGIARIERAMRKFLSSIERSLDDEDARSLSTQLVFFIRLSFLN